MENRIVVPEGSFDDRGGTGLSGESTLPSQEVGAYVGTGKELGTLQAQSSEIGTLHFYIPADRDVPGGLNLMVAGEMLDPLPVIELVNQQGTWQQQDNLEQILKALGSAFGGEEQLAAKLQPIIKEYMQELEEGFGVSF